MSQRWKSCLEINIPGFSSIGRLNEWIWTQTNFLGYLPCNSDRLDLHHSREFERDRAGELAELWIGRTLQSRSQIDLGKVHTCRRAKSFQRGTKSILALLPEFSKRVGALRTSFGALRDFQHSFGGPTIDQAYYDCFRAFESGTTALLEITGVMVLEIFFVSILAGLVGALFGL